jgi:hypothetical protein
MSQDTKKVILSMTSVSKYHDKKPVSNDCLSVVREGHNARQSDA